MSDTGNVELELRVGKGRYRLSEQLGSGPFGEMFSGTDMTQNEQVAIKLEPVGRQQPRLLHESKIYTILNSKSMEGIPKMRWYGTEGSYLVLVMDLLGPSLDDLFRSCECRFGLKTVLLVADQLLTRIEDLHGQHFIHRSIKPHNLVIGCGDKKHTIHMIDFGTAMKFRDPTTLRHVPYRTDCSLTQRPSFSSIPAHIGIQQSRRDDLESLGYTLVYFLLGSLPWDNITSITRRKMKQKILSCMGETSIDKLCEGCPQEFVTYFDYCRKLGFEEEPDYAYLKGLFRELFERNGFQDDNKFDWDVLSTSNAKKAKAKDEASLQPDSNDTNTGREEGSPACGNDPTQPAPEVVTDETSTNTKPAGKRNQDAVSKEDVVFKGKSEM